MGIPSLPNHICEQIIFANPSPVSGPTPFSLQFAVKLMFYSKKFMNYFFICLFFPRGTHHIPGDWTDLPLLRSLNWWSRFSAQIYNKPCLHAINVARRFNAVGCAGPAYAETSHSPCELAVLIMRSIHFASSKLPLWKVQNFENISVHDQPFSHQMIFQQVDFVRESKPRAWIGLEASGLSQGPC